jgi:hypothetical protein
LLNQVERERQSRVRRLVMKRSFSSGRFALALTLSVVATAWSASASAQSLSHYGSPLPRYYDAEGVQHWGSWAPPIAEQKRSLYLDAKPNGRQKTPRRDVR